MRSASNRPSLARRCLAAGASAGLLALLSGCGNLGEPLAAVEVLPSPVAFVTAAPPPQATLTPTPQPLPTDTPIPPTPAPKRKPQESTAAIGLWSSQLQSAEAFPGFLDLAVGDAARDYQRTRNQFLIALAQQQVAAAAPEQLSELRTSRPDWLLYDRNRRIAFSSANSQAPLLDIRKEEVRSRLAEQAASLIDAGAFDGILLQEVGVDLIRPTAAPVFTATRPFTEQQRREAVEGLLRAIRDRIPNKLIIIGGYAWRDGAAFAARREEAQALATLADGIHIEYFLRTPLSKTNEFKPEAEWKRDVDYLSVASQDDKIVLLTTPLGEAPADLTRQWLNYATASYLLGKNGSYTYFQFASADPTYAGDPILSAPIGAPVEPYTKLSSGIYQRRFSRGLVLVNPSNEQKRTTLDAAYKTLQGNPAESAITMGPRTGIILLSAQ
jgi:hypothetical protein